MLVQPFPQRLARNRSARVERDERLGSFSHVRIRDANRQRLPHVRMAIEHGLDLAWEHLEAAHRDHVLQPVHDLQRSEEHTSELQSLMRISYAVFCLKKKKQKEKKHKLDKIIT